jgi:di/tricarboxylate transporter
MENLIGVFASIGMTFVCFLIFCAIYLLVINSKNRKKHKPQAKTKAKKYVTFTKRKFDIILYHGIFWVDLSYILAFMDKQQIAETLSVQAVISIIGVFAAYCIKSAYEKKIGKEKEEYENVFTEIDQ